MRGTETLARLRYRMTQPRRKILCIEDDHETAALIAEELADRKFHVSVVHDGIEGFATILKDMPDLVLCDIGMPRMSGFEVLERLTAIAPRLGHIPFVFLTGLNDRDSELKGRQLGADDYVTKPIDFDILGAIIHARLTRVAREAVWPKKVELSSREIQALTMVAQGRTSAEIARQLGMSKRTVDYHIENACTKLKATTRTQAATKAAIGKLIEP
jgi:DNA-binding NarL/FixJ family response regulator